METLYNKSFTIDKEVDDILRDIAYIKGCSSSSVLRVLVKTCGKEVLEHARKQKAKEDK